MSLNWNLKKIKDHEKLCWVPCHEVKGNVRLNSVTEVLIWLSLEIGLDEITEKNYKEFFIRVSLAEKLFGTYLFNPRDGDVHEPRPITLEDIKSHIGLDTNASNMTKTAFHKRMIDRFYREADEKIKRKEKETVAV